MIVKLLLDFDNAAFDFVKARIALGVERERLNVHRVRVESRGAKHHHVYVWVECDYEDDIGFIMYMQLQLGSDPEREAMLKSRADSPDCFPGDSWNEFWLSKNGQRYVYDSEATKKLWHVVRWYA